MGNHKKQGIKSLCDNILKTDFNQLSNSLYNVIPTASALGVQFGDVTAALAVMTAQGTPTAVATTQMRQLFVELSKDGGKAAEMFEKLAGKSFQQFIAEGGNVNDALEIMGEGAKKNNVQIQDLFGSVEAGNAAIALYDNEGFVTALDEMAAAAGATDKAYAQMDQGVDRSLERIKVLFANLKLDIGKELGPLAEEELTKLADKLREVDWAEVIRQAKEFGQKVLPPLRDALVKIGEVLSKLTGEQIAWGVGLFAAAAALAPIFLVLSSVFTVLGGVTSGIGTFIGFAKGLSPVMKGIGKSGGLLSKAFSKIGKVFGVLSKAFMGIVKIGRIVMVAFAGISAPVWGIIAAVAAVIAIGVLLYKNWDVVKAKAQEIWGSIKELFVSVVDSTKERFELFKSIVKLVVESVVEFFTNLKDNTVEIFTTVYNKLSEIWTNVKTTISDAVTSVVEFVTTAWDNIVEKTTTIFNGIKSFFELVWIIMLMRIRNVVTTIYQVVTEKWTSIKTKTTEIFDKVKSFVSGVWENIKTNTKTAVENIRSSAVQKFTDLKDGIAKKLEEGKTKVEEIWKKIKEGFSLTNLKEIGKNVIQGLIDGMTGMKDAVWDKAKEIAGSIEKAAKSILGIKSPSRVMKNNVGKWIPLGIAEGIEANMNPLRQATEKMTNATMPNMSGFNPIIPEAGSRGIASISNTNTTNYAPNITINSNDPHAVFREQERLMRRIKFQGGI